MLTDSLPAVGASPRGTGCWLVGFGLLVFYGISFFLPAVTFGRPDFGWEVCFCYTTEWKETLWGFYPAYALWLANPLFLVGIAGMLARKPFVAATCGIVSVILVSGPFLFGLGNLLIGGYVWFSSMIGLAFAGWAFSVAANAQNRMQAQPFAFLDDRLFHGPTAKSCRGETGVSKWTRSPPSRP
jgi:hypothetical protein